MARRNERREHMNKNMLYRSIPKVDILLQDELIKEMTERYGRESVMASIHVELARLRKFIADSESEAEAEEQIQLLVSGIVRTVEAAHTPNMKKVINGTGTILHTNLGRAPISRAHMEKAFRIVTGYSNLEYNLEKGRRGERYSHFEELLCKITGAEAAMAVNNNASSVLLILSSLAKGGEVIVSRGELIEIGGKFRIPDVMEQSGAALVEVGTTNKTHFSDYEEHITEETKALLKVHTSNYRIVGFTESVTIDELVPLAREREIPVIEDLGSGVLIDLSKYGLSYEPTVQESIAKGADVVCFSGDKLFGGPQAGIIVGRKKYIDKMKKNQLTRALRIDKFTAAALELVLQEYLSEEKAIRNIPVLRMITEPLDEAARRARSLARMVRAAGIEGRVEVVSCESQIGGGSLPLERIPSMAVAIRPEGISVAEMEERMRRLPVPIIPRTVNDTVMLDVRTIETEDFKLVAAGIQNLTGLEK
jgi:L-seryl-tRNA(Ser) seleniumtransferase